MLQESHITLYAIDLYYTKLDIRQSNDKSKNQKLKNSHFAYFVNFREKYIFLDFHTHIFMLI